MGHRYLSRLKGRREDERLFKRENCMHPCYIYTVHGHTKQLFFSLSKLIVWTRPPRLVKSFFLEACCTCTAFLAMCPPYTNRSVRICWTQTVVSGSLSFPSSILVIYLLHCLILARSGKKLTPLLCVNLEIRLLNYPSEPRLWKHFNMEPF